MLGNVGLNLLVPQFPHQWSGQGEPSPSGKRFGVCALASMSTGYGSGLAWQDPPSIRHVQNTGKGAGMEFTSASLKFQPLFYTCS